MQSKSKQEPCPTSLKISSPVQPQPGVQITKLLGRPSRMRSHARIGAKSGPFTALDFRELPSYVSCCGFENVASWNASSPVISLPLRMIEFLARGRRCDVSQPTLRAQSKHWTAELGGDCFRAKGKHDFPNWAGCSASSEWSQRATADAKRDRSGDLCN